MWPFKNMLSDLRMMAVMERLNLKCFIVVLSGAGQTAESINELG